MYALRVASFADNAKIRHIKGAHVVAEHAHRCWRAACKGASRAINQSYLVNKQLWTRRIRRSIVIGLFKNDAQFGPGAKVHHKAFQFTAWNDTRAASRITLASHLQQNNNTK